MSLLFGCGAAYALFMVSDEAPEAGMDATGVLGTLGFRFAAGF
jgi:hypothetical protein